MKKDPDDHFASDQPTTGRPDTRRRRNAHGRTTNARQALIESAIGNFAAKGFAGARVDEISAEAGVNKQLVYHYFSSKQGLYQAALEQVYAEIRAKEKALSLEAMDPRTAMQQLVGFSFDYLQDHPEFIALLEDENRNRGRYILESDELRSMHSPFIQMLQETLDRGVHDGQFPPGYDAIHLYISIAGISYFFFSNNHTLSAIFGQPLDTAEARAKRRAHVIAFVMNALRP